eukprot:Seg2063.6 transcript_id=Seg2063.6/GoldUCD/mRNA.D3Y31 product="Sperm-associated antigen 7-like" protein_id=Seg2063.6/GoldUCD/D3Y31
MESQISEFMKDTVKKHTKFSAMDKIARSIVHDVAEVAGLTSFSFGEENIDRYIMIWKKEFAPSDAELDARRNGEEWDEEKEKQHTLNLEKKLKAEEENTKINLNSRKRNHNKEPEKYFDKYAKILGGDSGVDAAKATKTNAAYGMVPSKNKTDQRSIEETMNAIRERKRQRTGDGPSTDE